MPSKIRNMQATANLACSTVGRTNSTLPLLTLLVSPTLILQHLHRGGLFFYRLWSCEPSHRSFKVDGSLQTVRSTFSNFYQTTNERWDTNDSGQHVNWWAQRVLRYSVIYITIVPAFTLWLDDLQELRKLQIVGVKVPLTRQKYKPELVVAYGKPREGKELCLSRLLYELYLSIRIAR